MIDERYPAAFLDECREILKDEFPAFLRALALPPRRALRLNPQRNGAEQAAAPFLPDGAPRVPWEPLGRYLAADAKPGAGIAHAAGAFYLQDASAMAPVAALDPRPGERVLDLCAAPGGKSGQIAARLNGRGFLLSNEIEFSRARILLGNLERLGVTNAFVTSAPAEALARVLPAFFDRVLVDAPCSGEGMFRKEEAAVADWSPETVDMCARRQLEILRSAARMLAPGGRLVYSTCTFAPQENEGVISRFLAGAPEFSAAKADAPWFAPGRPDWIENPAPGIEHTFRLWPHKLHGEGHFAAVLEKASDAPVGAAISRPYGSPGGQLIAAPTDLVEFCKETGAALPEGRPLAFRQSLFWVPEETPDLKGLKVLRPGLELGEILKNRFEPAHAWALWLKTANSTVDFPADSPEIAVYLRGETISGQAKGWTLLTVDGLSLGWVKGSGGILKNHFPKALRHLA